ncbi:MAG TPA: 2-polyprenyl-3-methyl-6-methoxy-1,4-benzoquinone monooxygenase [Steroidobacteraceae bacterium]|nr:2-polyprenyl-3-methyl-6-methoxy-1,4-benzoquinone monooxygenase [Steroidobacteraceae bacterium]
MDNRRIDPLDRVIGEIDKIIKNLTLPARASRPYPQGPAADTLENSERAQSLRLMRVNHAGEVAAQALYRGQALTARDPEVKAAMNQAAAEEIDHLAWCEQRLEELKGRPSLLNPIWYLGSLTLGAFAGSLGDRASLGFIAETEKQVESHLRGHLARLSPNDLRSKAILTQMTHDEMQHGAKAASMGGKPLPFPITLAMRAASQLMTRGSYWI